MATGVIDAVSILGLGRVFVANMTGNVVFVGFALAGAPGFSLPAVLTVFLGALVGSVLFLRAGIGWSLGLALVLVALVAGVAALHSAHPAEWQHGRR